MQKRKYVLLMFLLYLHLLQEVEAGSTRKVLTSAVATAAAMQVILQSAGYPVFTKDRAMGAVSAFVKAGDYMSSTMSPVIDEPFLAISPEALRSARASLNRIPLHLGLEQEMPGDGQILIIDQLIKKAGFERSKIWQKRHIKELEMRVTMLEIGTQNSNFIWKIDDVSRRLEEAKAGKVVSLYSVPFYTTAQGYRLCLRLYLNGDGVGKGKYVSAFLVVMRGEYDQLLSWPFPFEVMIRILDQTPDKSSCKHIEKEFRPNPLSNSFSRPASPMNVASGMPEFISLTELLAGGEDGSRQYILNDTMFVQAIILPIRNMPVGKTMSEEKTQILLKDEPDDDEDMELD